MLTVGGKNGGIDYVSQGFGLGIREHDDVMLAWGYSRKTYLEVTIPTNQFAVIKTVIPEGLTHHAEGRILFSSGGSTRLRVYKNVTPANFPTQVSLLPILNEKYAELITLTTDGTIFTYHGVSASNPIVSGDLVDNYPIFAEDGQGNNSGSPAISESLRGRFYDDGTYAVVIQNISNTSLTVYYQYNWHEYY